MTRALLILAAIAHAPAVAYPLAGAVAYLASRSTHVQQRQSIVTVLAEARG